MAKEFSQKGMVRLHSGMAVPNPETVTLWRVT